MRHFSFFFFLYGITLYAQNSIDDEITQIMKSPPQERVQLMNQLKSKIAAMNEQERSALLKNMQSQINSMPNSSGHMNHNTPPSQIQMQMSNPSHRQNRR